MKSILFFVPFPRRIRAKGFPCDRVFRFLYSAAFRIAAFVSLVICLTQPATAQWRAGIAKTKITPKSLMWMAGYASRDHPATGTLTDLWAKALLLQDRQGETGLLITLDLIGIDRDLSKSVCTKLQNRFKLHRRQIAICTSHTHTGPVVAGNLRPMHYELLDESQREKVEDYVEFLEKSILGLVQQAFDDLRPARLSWAVGRCDFAVNRRNNPEKQVPELRAQGALKGPVDHDVPVLAMRDQADKLFGIVFGYACHATVLSSYQWSGDYAGFAQISLENAHPDCTALFWAGCGADQNPLPRRTVQLARKYGDQLAESVNRVLAGSMQPLEDQLRSSFNEIALPLDTLPTVQDLRNDLNSSNRYVAARARVLLARIDNGQPLSPSYPYAIANWRLGSDVKMVFLGGEVVVDYALRLKSELSRQSTWVAGYANDVMAYIPSRRVLREGGYEGEGAMVYYGLPTRWAPQVERLIVDEVKRQIAETP